MVSLNAVGQSSIAGNFQITLVALRNKQHKNKTMYYKLVLLPLVFLVFPSISHAQLGETMQESNSRYGSVVPNPPPNISQTLLANAVSRTYQYQGWRIQAGFLNNHTVRMRYSKLPKKNATQVIHNDEIAAILQAEAHGGNWEKIAKKSFLIPYKKANLGWQKAQTRFENSNNCRAYLTNGHMNLYVDAPEAALWENTVAEEQDRQRKKNIPSF